MEKLFSVSMLSWADVFFHMRDIGSDADTMPQARLVAHIILASGEEPALMERTCSLRLIWFTIPEEWHGHLAYDKKVPWSVLGVAGGGETYVWSASVGLIQDLLRRLVYNAALISPECELRVGQPFPLEQVAVTCIDGFDVVSRVPPDQPRSVDGRLFPMTAFTLVCVCVCVKSQVCLYMLANKLCVLIMRPLLGGELDGRSGVLRHDRTKGHKLANNTLALFASPTVSQTPPAALGLYLRFRGWVSASPFFFFFKFA